MRGEECFKQAFYGRIVLTREEMNIYNNLGWCRDSSVGVATRYGLERPGIESRCGWDSPHPSRTTLGPIQPPIKWIPCLFPRGEAAGTWRWPLTPSRAEVKERVQAYLYSPSGPLWPVLERNFLLLNNLGKMIKMQHKLFWNCLDNVSCLYINLKEHQLDTW